MPAPGVGVTIAPAAVADGTLTSTNSAFMAYAATSGPTKLATISSGTQATAAGLTGAALQTVLDLLTSGVPQVNVSRVAITGPTTAASVDADGWGEALDKFTDQLPMGQMLIPGVGTAAAHDALVAASQVSHRTALLDAPQNASAAAVVDLAEAQEDKADTYATALFADYTTVSLPGGEVRAIAGSVGAAGAIARRDAAVGHTNWMAAGVPNGLFPVGEAVQTTRTREDLDAFAEAGVNPTLLLDGSAYLYDFLSLTADPDWTALVNGSRSQLNFGRLAMQILGDTRRGLRQYLFAPGDALTQAAAEDYLRAYLTNLWSRRALFPNDDASKAFSAHVLGVTTTEDVRNQILRAAITMTPTPGVRQVTLVAAVNGVA